MDREELRSARRVSSSLSDELEVESDGWKVGGSELEDDSDELKRSDSWSSCVFKVVNPLAGIPSSSPCDVAAFDSVSFETSRDNAVSMSGRVVAKSGDPPT